MSFCVHFVEFVYTAYPFVTQHQSTTLQDKLFCLRIFANVGCQPCWSWSSAASVHASWRYSAHLLQKLGFGCAGITNQANVDLGPDLISISFLLPISSKKLSQQTFFHLQVSENAWSKTLGKFVDDFILIGHFKKGFSVLLIKTLWINFYSFVFALHDSKRYNIEIGSKNSSIYFLSPWYFTHTAPINSWYLYTISRSDLVNTRIISQYSNRGRRLPLRNVLQLLLKLQVLFVDKQRSIMFQLKYSMLTASLAFIRLLHSPIFKFDHLLLATSHTLKESWLHFRIDVGCSYHYPSQFNQTSKHGRYQIFNTISVLMIKINKTYFQTLFSFFHCFFCICVSFWLNKFLLIYVLQDPIEYGNDFHWKIY